MKILLLSPYPHALAEALHEAGDSFIAKSDPIDLDFCLNNQIEFLVSYGYRHMISASVLSHFPLKAVNLHISLLPYARGAHPNFWSIAEGSPTGVTIHLLYEALDTGNILFQREVCIDHDLHTFATSYRLLSRELERLFLRNWHYIRRSACWGWRQEGGSTYTYHRSAEIEQWVDCLPQMWDTPIHLFEKLARKKPGHVHRYMG